MEEGQMEEEGQVEDEDQGEEMAQMGKQNQATEVINLVVLVGQRMMIGWLDFLQMMTEDPDHAICLLPPLPCWVLKEHLECHQDLPLIYS